MRSFILCTAAVLALGCLLVPTVRAEDGPDTVKPTALGAVVPDFTTRDTEGKSFQLYKRGLDRKAVEASLRQAVAAVGGSKSCPLSTTFESLEGLQEEGEYDPYLTYELLANVAGTYGRVATEASVKSIKTLGDAVDWIMKVDKAPLVLMCWSPRCGTTNKLNDAIHEKLASVDVRVYALACNYKDTDEHFAMFREKHGFALRIFVDREQKVTDILGGERTPHFFVIDPKNVLRFRGSLDNDPMGTKEAAEREDWLLDAVKAVAAGKPVPKAETPGPG